MQSAVKLFIPGEALRAIFGEEGKQLCMHQDQAISDAQVTGGPVPAMARKKNSNHA